MSEDTRTMLKKLMRDSLDEKDRQRLLCDPRVEERMRSQWDEVAEDMNPMVGDRIWGRIIARTIAQNNVRKLYVYKIMAIAASVLLLLGVGSWVYWANTKEDQYIYVMASGVRCIESVSLSDGTMVRMGPNSQLTYPKSFNGETRDVDLKGQAFFDVAKDRDKPFTVHTKNMDVTALGTAFEVFNHESENKLETILLNGKVKIGLGDPNIKNRREVILNPNEMLVYDKQANTVKVKKVNAEIYSGWRNGVLSFENERLSMILTRLEPWYGRKIKCPKEIAEKYRFTFKVRDESLERILFMLSNTSPIKYREKDSEYELYIKGR
ncbi:FecR domain-containing protein [uncultured Parabacteroides sp.]|uniref:FecR family protein n=1 Tax=uncultured Parabacteroides sp. TaxID=512312 RepID=UPI00261D2800|nr:FecR domain-containing protein [uncultured Parabacteroides sp.]